MNQLSFNRGALQGANSEDCSKDYRLLNKHVRTISLCPLKSGFIPCINKCGKWLCRKIGEMVTYIQQYFMYVVNVCCIPVVFKKTCYVTVKMERPGFDHCMSRIPPLNLRFSFC